jgi:nucleotide-binding universal stress UspA family protein
VKSDPGPLWKTILAVADDDAAGLVVLGSRGLTGLRSMLMGSVSSAVVHHAARPTLVIPHAHESVVVT